MDLRNNGDWTWALNFHHGESPITDFGQAYRGVQPDFISARLFVSSAEPIPPPREYRVSSCGGEVTVDGKLLFFRIKIVLQQFVPKPSSTPLA